MTNRRFRVGDLVEVLDDSHLGWVDGYVESFIYTGPKGTHRPGKYEYPTIKKGDKGVVVPNELLVYPNDGDPRGPKSFLAVLIQDQIMWVNKGYLRKV